MKNSKKTEVLASKDKNLDKNLRGAQHQAKQKKLQQQMSYGALAILAVVVVSFVAWPILSNGPNASDNISFGSYRGEPINYSSEYGLFNNALQSFLNQFGAENNAYYQGNVFERAFFSTVSQYGHYFFLARPGP